VITLEIFQIFSFLGTIAIFLAAFLISSKMAGKPKIRIYALIFYICACFFLGTMGAVYPTGPDPWMIIQQVVLFFINCRGIYIARKELRDSKACITCKFRENGYLCENDKVVCGDKYKGWKPRTK